MLKALFVFVCGTMVYQSTYAQKNSDTLYYYVDTLYYYVDRADNIVPKDSAYYVLAIMPRDTSDKESLYPVLEYYLNGKRALMATSRTHSLNLMLEGPCVKFYKTGRKKSIRTFKDGKITDDAIEYYPNGKLYNIKNYKDGKVTFIECRDSTGKVLCENGKGTWLEFDDDNKTVHNTATIEKGSVVDILSTNKNYNPKLRVDPTSPEYLKVEKVPAFTGGLDALFRFIYSRLKYPQIDKDNGISGKVVVGFVVEKDGSLTDIHIIKNPSQTMSEEAIRVMKLSPKWSPALQGGRPVRAQYTIPINFDLEKNK